IDGFSILLTGDAGPVALNEAADYIQANGLYSKGYPNLIQVPHHGSRKNVTPELLNRLIGGIVDPNASSNARAFCSVGS
ncbi:MBL fold metallo-hydrolase, partial [Escherichia coli]